MKNTDFFKAVSDSDAMANERKQRYLKRRVDLCFMVEEDFDLPATYQALLTNFFSDAAKDGDLQGPTKQVYHRYRRALLCFVGD